MNLWAITTALNLALCLILLFRGHFTRYKVLFLSLIFELLAAPTLYFIYSHYGTDSGAYFDAFHIKNFLTILFCFGIIWEGFLWRNQCVRIPSEFYLLTLIVKFMAEKAQLFEVSHGIYEMLRYAGIATLLWYIHCYSKESPYERKAFKARGREASRS